ncbi:MAG: c-type cytochrome, partial [Candidatus Puniceispirillales bacterium]
KQSQQDFKSLIKAAHNNDYDTALTLSIALEEWGLAMPDYFPEGSQQPPSEAADTIWSDAEGFNAAIDNYVRSVRAVNAAALAKDKSAIMAAIKETSDSCSSCHNAFRVK